MNAVRRLFLLLPLLMVLAGCNEKELIQKLTPESDDRLARQFLGDILQGDIDGAAALLDTEEQTPEAREGLEQLSGIFGKGELKHTEVIGLQVITTAQSGAGNQKKVQLSYQLELTTGWFAGTIVIRDQDSTSRIASARFKKLPKSLQELNHFTFRGRGIRYFAFFGLCIAIPLFCLVTLIVCIRTKLRRKWLWILCILLGVGTFSLNWTTGQIGIHPLNFLLLGASVFSPGIYGAWAFSFALPIGAVVFWLKRNKLKISEVYSSTGIDS